MADLLYATDARFDAAPAVENVEHTVNEDADNANTDGVVDSTSSVSSDALIDAVDGGDGVNTNSVATNGAGGVVTPGVASSCCVYVGNLPYSTTWQDLKDHMRQAGTVMYAKIFEDAYGSSKGAGLVEYSSVQEAQIAIDQLHNTKLGDRLIFVREDREPNAAGGVRGPRFPRGGSSFYSSPHQHQHHPSPPHHPHHLGNGAEYNAFRAFPPRGGAGPYRGRMQPMRPMGGPASMFSGPSPIPFARPGAYPPRGGMYGGPKGGHTGPIGAPPVAPPGTVVYFGNLPWATRWPTLKEHVVRAGFQPLRADVMTNESGRSRGYGIVWFATREEAEQCISTLNGYELDGRQLVVRFDNYSS